LVQQADALKLVNRDPEAGQDAGEQKSHPQLQTPAD
jgi:hypothetical protein